MPGETADKVSGFTVDTLKALMDERDKRYNQRAEAQDHAVTSALAGAQRANDKADLASEKRFEGVNEFRKAVNDIVTNKIDRSEIAALMTGINTKIDANSASIAGLENRIARMQGQFAALVGAAFILATVLGYFIHR